MKMWGLTMEDYHRDNTVEVCEENWLAVQFMQALGFGSWNMGMGGPTGLRYETFREVRLALGIKMSQWPQLFEDIRIMERAALQELHKDSEDG